MDKDYWYARDKDGRLFSYEKEPFKLCATWSCYYGDGFELTSDFGYDYIKWEDDSPVRNAEPVMPATDNLSSLFKLYYLEKKDMFVATIPVYISKEAIAGVGAKLEELLGSKVVVINGEFEYIKELHNFTS